MTDGPAAEPLDRAREKFPTAAVAVLDFKGEWADLTPGEARMADFAIPRDIPALNRAPGAARLLTVIPRPGRPGAGDAAGVRNRGRRPRG